MKCVDVINPGYFKDFFGTNDDCTKTMFLFLADIGVKYDMLCKTIKNPKDRSNKTYNSNKLSEIIKSINQYNVDNGIEYDKIKITGNKQAKTNNINNYLIFLCELYPVYDESSPFYNLDRYYSRRTGVLDRSIIIENPKDTYINKYNLIMTKLNSLGDEIEDLEDYKEYYEIKKILDGMNELLNKI